MTSDTTRDDSIFGFMSPSNFLSLFSQVPLSVPKAAPKPGPEAGHVNEQILRLMQSLGIDPARTKEVTRFQHILDELLLF